MNMPWEEYYLLIARDVARRSSCRKRQVGAILVLENRIIATGYNGTPRGTVNCDKGGCPRCNDNNIPSGTRLDECWCSHAEENCIVQCAYHGVSSKFAELYTTHSPCISCAKLIINAGIKTVLFWADYPQQAGGLLISAGVNLLRLEK